MVQLCGRLARLVPSETQFRPGTKRLGSPGDSVSDLSEDAMRHCIQGSVAVVVLLNDETLLSDWCRAEWECARSMGVPIQCVVDLERCMRQDILNKYRRDFPHLFKLQLLDYCNIYRKHCYAKLGAFLRVMLWARGLLDPGSCSETSNLESWQDTP